MANNDRFMEIRDPQGTYGDAGRIVLACRDYPGRIGVMVYSDDDGLTWQAGSSVPVRPDWGSQNFNEPGIVELDEGHFWMYGRTTMGFHAQSWSYDRGMTWSTPEPMELLGPCSPQTGERIPNTSYTEAMDWAGDVLFTFPNHDFVNYPREFTYTARTPLDAAISQDGAQTWSYVRTIEEDPEMQYGYSSVTFQEDEEVGMRVLLTTHVQPIPGYAYRPHDLKFTSIPLSWFYEDVDDPQRGIDFADEYPPDIPEPPEPPPVHDAYGKQVLAHQPVAYWRLTGQDEGGPETDPGLAHVGTVGLDLVDTGAGCLDGQPGPRPTQYAGFDTSNNAVELLNTGPYPWFPAEYGNCLITDRLVDLSGTGDFSMEMWFKHVGEHVGSSSIAEDFVTNGDLGYNTDMYLLELNGSGDPEFAPLNIRYRTTFSGQETDFTVDVPEELDWDAWHYLVFTKEGTVGNIYLDGVLLGSGTVNGDVTSTGETLGFGQDRNFKGLLDEIALYNFGLTAAEVAEHYTAALEGFAPGDLNGDGFVGGDDLDIVRSFWGQTVTPGNRFQGDPSGDGYVGGDDLDEVRAHWGEGTPPASRVVPEPSSAAILLGMVGWLTYRRRCWYGMAGKSAAGSRRTGGPGGSVLPGTKAAIRPSNGACGCCFAKWTSFSAYSTRNDRVNC